MWTLSSSSCVVWLENARKLRPSRPGRSCPSKLEEDDEEEEKEREKKVQSFTISTKQSGNSTIRLTWYNLKYDTLFVMNRRETNFYRLYKVS